MSPSNIRGVESLGPESFDRTLSGTVVSIPGSSVPGVNVQGNVIQARWADPIVASVDDTVLVKLIRTSNGTEAVVQSRVTNGPRPDQGTVSSISAPTMQVLGSDGVTYTADYVTSYTPTVADVVKLSWFGIRPTALGKVPAAPAAPQATTIAPPPPAPTTGQTSYAATDSCTYWSGGGWGSWAGDKGRVYQGNYGSGQVYGSFFYAGSPGQLAGRTITGCHLLMGNRLPVGASGSALTLHVYAHNSLTRPGGDVSRVLGPYDFTVYPGQGLTSYVIPIAAANQVISGGGISIALDPYCGFMGRNEQADSGKLIFDWSM